MVVPLIYLIATELTPSHYALLPAKIRGETLLFLYSPYRYKNLVTSLGVIGVSLVVR